MTNSRFQFQLSRLFTLFNVLVAIFLWGCSISTPIPDSIALVPKSPGTVAEGKQQITGGLGGKFQGTSSTIMPQAYGTGFLGFEKGLDDGLSLFTGLAHAYGGEDTTSYYDSLVINDNWIRPASFDHTQITLGLKKDLVDAGHISVYSAMSYHYLETATALSGILGLSAGYHNRFLTPYFSLSYEYAQPITNDWFSSKRELAFNGQDTTYVIPQYRMVSTGTSQFTWGLETDFGKIDSGMSLAVETSYGSYALKEENRRTPEGYIIISDGYNLSGDNLKDSGIWVVMQVLLKYTF